MNRCFEMQRKLRPVVGVIAIATGVIFFGSVLLRDSKKEEARMSDSAGAVVGGAFVVVGIAFIGVKSKGVEKR